MKYVKEFFRILLLALAALVVIALVVTFLVWPMLLPGAWPFAGYVVDFLLAMILVSIINVWENEGKI